jgi:uncharacterized damage-inducible protein DinB
MTIAQSMLPEFDQEMANTRKVMERVPGDQLNYKPDPKSMSLGVLAGHVVEMIGWTGVTINLPSFDIPADFKPFIPESRDEILALFEKNVAEARAALEGASDETMMGEWSLTSRGQTYFTMPRTGVVRSMLMNHIIHHRAQLTVYFRLVGVPVPGLYGPSADEQQAASA